MTCFVSAFRRQNVCVQMLIWSQIAGGRRRVCAAPRRVSTMLPVCRRETSLSAGEALTMEATPLQIIRRLCSCIILSSCRFVVIICFALWIFSVHARLHGEKRAASAAARLIFMLSSNLIYWLILAGYCAADVYYSDLKRQKRWLVFIESRRPPPPPLLVEGRADFLRPSRQ